MPRITHINFSNISSLSGPNCYTEMGYIHDIHDGKNGARFIRIDQEHKYEIIMHDKSRLDTYVNNISNVFSPWYRETGLLVISPDEFVNIRGDLRKIKLYHVWLPIVLVLENIDKSFLRSLAEQNIFVFDTFQKACEAGFSWIKDIVDTDSCRYVRDELREENYKQGKKTYIENIGNFPVSNSTKSSRNVATLYGRSAEESVSDIKKDSPIFSSNLPSP